MTETAESTGLGPDAIRGAIRELVLELAPNKDVTDANPEMSLVDDLNFHSLALLELAFTLEDEFSLDPISEEAVLNIVTVGDVEAHVIAETSAKAN